MIVMSVGMLVLSACQSANESQTNTNKTSVVGGAETEALDQTVSSHGLPSSNGPSQPPNSKGPTSSQAQAVTQNENIRLSLPLKVEKSE